MATDYMSGYNPSQSTNTGWSDYTFTEEDLKYFEAMGLDVRNALAQGFSPEEIISRVKEIETERGGGISPQGEYVDPVAIEKKRLSKHIRMRERLLCLLHNQHQYKHLLIH